MPVADALAAVLDGAAALGEERVPLAEAHRRVLAHDLAALRTQPPAPMSAMDGYAVRAADAGLGAATLRDRRSRGRATVHARRSAAAKRRAFSPAASCRKAPTPW